jgi:UDP-2-acetamido-3-amino-2,3-dideoxy-glucuronate N-acetyltransferase
MSVPPEFSRIAPDVTLGADVVIHGFVNLYGCQVGAGTSIGSFVEIQKGATIGERCKIQSHSFICEGVTIGNECFVGHGVIFINDRNPLAANTAGRKLCDGDWTLEKTVVSDRASIGSGAIIMCGLNIGKGALIGAGAVVTKNVAPGAVVAGVPSRVLRHDR